MACSTHLWRDAVSNNWRVQCPEMKRGCRAVAIGDRRRELDVRMEIAKIFFTEHEALYKRQCNA